jgi:hypothetical protein
MDKSILLREVAAFRRNRDAEIHQLRQTALLSKFGSLGGSDLTRRSVAELGTLVRSIRQALSRERLRGLGRHHRYDINRHIALKELLDQVMALPQMQNGAEAPSRKPYRRRRRLSRPALAAEAHGARQI